MIKGSLSTRILVILAIAFAFMVQGSIAVQPQTAQDAAQLKPSALVEVGGAGGDCGTSAHTALTATDKFTEIINDGITKGFASEKADTIANCSPAVSTTALLPTVAAKAVASPSTGYFRRSLESAFVRNGRCYTLPQARIHKKVADAFIELFATMEKPKNSANFIVGATRVLYNKPGSTPVAAVSLPNFPPLCFTDKYDKDDAKVYGDRLKCKGIADWIKLNLDPIPDGFEAYATKLGYNFTAPLTAAKFTGVHESMMLYFFQDAKNCLEKDECDFADAVKSAGIRDICEVNHINFNFHQFIDSACNNCHMRENLPAMFDPYLTYLKAKCSAVTQEPVTVSVHESSFKLLSPFGRVGCELYTEDYNPLESQSTAHLIPGIHYGVDPHRGVIVPNNFEVSPNKFNELYYYLHTKNATKSIRLSSLCEDVRAGRGPAEDAMNNAKACPQPCPVLYTPPVIANATAANATAAAPRP